MNIDKIIIADDNESFRNSLARFLGRAANCQIDTVSTADDLVSKVKQDKYLAIVSDTQMEDGHETEKGAGDSGVYALQEIRKFNEKIPFVLMSADMNANLRQKAMAAGATECYSKNDLMKIKDLIKQYGDD